MNILHRALNALRPRTPDLTREIIAPAIGGLSHRHHLPIDQGLTPAQLTALLRDADYGYADAYLTLAEEMEERNPHYASVLSTRKRAVLGLDHMVESATDKRSDKKLADAVREYLAGPSLNGLLSGLLDALGKGYSAVELLWDTSATPWIPRYAWRDPRFFRYDRETGRTLLLAPTVHDDGQPLPPYRFVVHQPQLKMGLPIRGGLARLCAVTHLCARLALEDWLLFAEVFGMPLRIGRYNSSASSDDIEVLKTAVAGLGRDAAAVLHESMQIDFQAAASGAGGADLYERLLDRLDKLISKAVLGRSDAADATSGKLGNEQASSEVRRDILESDAADLTETINAQLVRPFIDLNFGPQAHYPTLKLHVPDQEDLTGLVDMLAKLVPLGLRVEQSIIRDKFGLPDPDEGAELLGAPVPAPEPQADVEDPDDVEDPAVNRALNRASPAAADPTAPLVERLGNEAEPLMNALLEPVRAALNDSADLMDFR
ncbi:MAG TPA: DUF935 family protein, partial [Candidatus Competibacteraceae bacterium]|nr:DUF935 family protein [Candidatus Competibacteraceae bacterium]